MLINPDFFFLRKPFSTCDLFVSVIYIYTHTQKCKKTFVMSILFHFTTIWHVFHVFINHRGLTPRDSETYVFRSYCGNVMRSVNLNLMVKGLRILRGRS